MDVFEGQLKSILKESSTPSGPRTEEERQARNREIAIQHATILQHRKDLESQILDSVIELSTYPPSPATTAANPTPEDAAGFRKLVRLFQPSDYDELVEERNVNGLCGYSLCPNPKRGGKEKGGDWVVRNGLVVSRKEWEAWCSNACKKRGLYVKVQLSESAAWERAGMPDIEIDLLEEEKENKQPETEADKTARQLADMKLRDQELSAEDKAALAMERGDSVTQPAAVKVSLKEKEVRPIDVFDDGAFEDVDDHAAVDGYRVKSLPIRGPRKT